MDYKIYFCPECQKDMGTIYYDTKSKTILCHNPEEYVYFENLDNKDFHILLYISREPSFLLAMDKLKKDDIIEYESRMSQFRTQVKQQEQQKENSKNQIKCPICGSTNIQIANRKWSLVTGFMTNKVDRVCVNCKYKF